MTAQEEHETPNQEIFRIISEFDKCSGCEGLMDFVVYFDSSDNSRFSRLECQDKTCNTKTFYKQYTNDLINFGE